MNSGGSLQSIAGICSRWHWDAPPPCVHMRLLCMSRLAELRKLELQLAAPFAELESMKGVAGLQLK